MKKTAAVLRYIGVGFSLFAGIAFGFIEFRTLVSGDLKLMENPVNAGLGYGFRVLFFALMLVNGILLIISLSKKKRSEVPDLIFNAFLVGVGFLSLTFYHWYISLVIIAFNAITLGIRTLYKGEKVVETPKEKED